MIATQLNDLENREAAKVAEENETRRAALAQEYVKLLQRDTHSSDDVEAIFELAKGLGRTAAEVEADHAALLAWQKYHVELLPELTEAEKERQKNLDAVAAARTKLRSLEKAEKQSASRLSTVQVAVRNLPKLCSESMLFDVDGRNVTPAFDFMKTE